MSYSKNYLTYLFGNNQNKKIRLPKDIPWGSLTFEETLMFKALTSELETYLFNLDFNTISQLDSFHLFKFIPLIKNIEIIDRIKAHFYNDFNFYSEVTSQKNVIDHKQLDDLLNHTVNTLTAYAILKSNRKSPRKSPGYFLIKDKNNEWVKNELGERWSIPILGMSSRGLDFYYTNGQTPQGVYEIMGVMPKADKYEEFGEYRRLIIDFKKDPQLLLPETHQELNWWNEAVLAQKQGRSHLRIHGAGRKNYNIFSSYFPFVPTSGCLATREGNFLFKRYNDQRLILDQLMKAQGLEVNFLNEMNIRANLIVVSIFYS